MNQIDKLAWIYVQDKKVLGARSKGKDLYYIPGGKREHGESDKAALIREIKEELSVDLLPDTIQHAGTFEAQAHEKSDGVTVKMTCYFAAFTGDLAASAEIEEIIWLTEQDVKKCSPVTQKILAWLTSENMI